VPFQNTFLFNPFLSLLEKIDSILLKFPFLKWFSWQIIFILSEPKKSIPQPKDLQEGLSGDLITKESQAYKRISNGISLTRIIAMFWIVSVNYFQLVFKNFYNQEYPDAVAKTQNFIEVMKNSHFIDKIFLPFFYSGWSGVVIFVIISGFSLWLSILVSKKFKIGEYIIERFNGIYVPYFVAVIISIFVNYYFLKGTPQPYVLPALLLGAAKFVPAAQWVNSPLWFISLILVCYLFFPIIPIIYNKFRLIGILVITIISSIVMFYLWDVFHTTTVRGVTNPILSSLYPLFPFWAFLCIGVLLCHLIYKSIMIQLRKTIQEYVKILLPLFFVIVGTIFLFKILYLDPSKNSEIPWQINPWLAGMAGTLVFLSAGYLLPVRFYRILRWLSRGTFTVFLYHYVASPLVVKHISPNIILTPHISIAIILMYLAMLIGFSVCQSFVDNTLVKFVKSLCKKDYEIV
jgi:peptidoglycan/LPS O-acetylase OafA/YrhL